MGDETVIRKVEETVRIEKSSGCGPGCDCGPECDCHDECTCGEVSDHLFELLDSEVPEEQAARLMRHVTKCPHCTKMAEAESHVRDIVKRSCCESAPSTLRMKITSQLAVYHRVTE